MKKITEKIISYHPRNIKFKKGWTAEKLANGKWKLVGKQEILKNIPFQSNISIKNQKINQEDLKKKSLPSIRKHQKEISPWSNSNRSKSSPKIDSNRNLNSEKVTQRISKEIKNNDLIRAKTSPLEKKQSELEIIENSVQFLEKLLAETSRIPDEHSDMSTDQQEKIYEQEAQLTARISNLKKKVSQIEKIKDET